MTSAKNNHEKDMASVRDLLRHNLEEAFSGECRLEKLVAR